MKRLWIIMMGACTCWSVAAQAQLTPEKLGWKLGTQAWSFHQFTFFEAVDSTLACGLHYIEAFPNQPIGGGIPGKMDYHMSPETRRQILQKLKQKGVTLVSYGVVVPEGEKEWRQMFDFAKAMGLINIVSEPKKADLPLISRLCDAYHINVAIHNHPRQSGAPYWSPDIVLAAIKGLSPRVGACADIGHWTRSGLNPIECLRKLQGHIIELHFKDLNEKSPDAHDVPWGQGVNNIAGVIHELYRQHFKGVISAEYEYDWGHNVHDIQESVAYFRKVVAGLK
mgnify:FL=1